MEQPKEVTKFSLMENIAEGSPMYLIALVKDITDMTVYRPDDVSYRTNVLITDGRRTISFYIWRSIEEVNSYLEIGGVYRMYGHKKTFNGSATFRYSSSDKVTDEDVLRKFDLTTYRGLLHENQIFFVESLRKIKDFRYRRLVELCYGLGKCPDGLDRRIYSRRYDRQLGGSGSINHHDNYPGGYINHLVGMLRVVDSLEAIYGNRYTAPVGRMEHYCDINWDIVRTLVVLHDLGKQKTYTLTLNNRVVFKRGTRLDHADVSMLEVYKCFDEMERDLAFSYEEEQALLSGIQNHGEHSYSKTPEEQILAQLDVIDSVLVDVLQII